MEMLKLGSLDLDDIFQGVDLFGKTEPLLPPIDENEADFLFNVEDALFSWPLTATAFDQVDDEHQQQEERETEKSQLVGNTTTESISPKAVVDGVPTKLIDPKSRNENGEWNNTNTNNSLSEGSDGLVDSSHSESAALTTQKAQRPRRTAAERKQKIREKNRRAQNKYREKLKTQRQETEIHLETTIADVHRLKLENTQLAGQVDVKERILEVRESAVQLLEAGKASFSNATLSDGLLKRLGPSAPRPLAYAPHDRMKTVQQLNESTEKCPLTNLTFQEVTAIKASGHQYLKKRYAELAERLRDVLQEVDDPRCSQTSREMSLEAMKNILWECGCLCFEHAVANPTGMQKLLAASVQDGDATPAEDKTIRWARIADQLKLTDQQLRQLEPHKNLFQRRIQRITKAKRSAILSLNSVVPTSTTDGNNAQPTSMSETTSRWLQVQAASQELSATIHEEYVACMEFVAKSFGDVFTPLQKARAIASSYPDFPDAYAIATAACKLHEKRLE